MCTYAHTHTPHDSAPLPAVETRHRHEEQRHIGLKTQGQHLTVCLLGPLNHYQKTPDILRCFSLCLEFQPVCLPGESCLCKAVRGVTELLQRPSESLSQHSPQTPQALQQLSDGGSRGVPPSAPRLCFPPPPAHKVLVCSPRSVDAPTRKKGKPRKQTKPGPDRARELARMTGQSSRTQSERMTYQVLCSLDHWLREYSRVQPRDLEPMPRLPGS